MLVNSLIKPISSFDDQAHLTALEKMDRMAASDINQMSW
jgi:hypothetical protein